jgi:hypothetical protein
MDFMSRRYGISGLPGAEQVTERTHLRETVLGLAAEKILLEQVLVLRNLM